MSAGDVATSAGTGAGIDDDVLMSVRDLVVDYKVGRKAVVQAVSGVSFDVRRGETLGLVGESGCGKSSVGRALIRLLAPTSGSVVFEGQDLLGLSAPAMRRQRPKLQMIFQDPISSLNPRRKVRDIVAEGLGIWGTGGAEAEAKVRDVLDAVGIDLDLVGDRRRHQFSGGQCQRISIARALVLEPDMIVCDEPVSALDVSVQAQILNLLHDMKARYGLTLIFIAHDLAVVKNVSDRVVVMYLGKICELAASEELYERPFHPYTRGLIDAIPEPDPDARPQTSPLSGDLPSPMNPPAGCRFRTRCPRAQAECGVEPRFRELAPGHLVACHLPLEGPDDLAWATAQGEVPVAVGGSVGPS